MTKQKCYAEFRAKVALDARELRELSKVSRGMPLDAIREELATAELSKRYAVHPTMFNGWKRQVTREHGVVVRRRTGRSTADVRG